MSVTALKRIHSESHADTIRRLREEAQSAALDHARAFESVIADLMTLASDIAEGGEAYPVGVREEARRLTPELTRARLNVMALLGRQG